MKTEDIVCKKCGLVNEYKVIDKNGQKTAWCNGCDAWIKNIPHAEPMMYFGKYKGAKIFEVTDRQYLQWCLEKGLFKGNIKDAVEKRISEL